MKHIFSAAMLLLVSVGMLTSGFGVQIANAYSGSIIINPDGSISSPVSANITTTDNVTYTFTGNNYLPIVVQRNNTIINGNKHTLQGNGTGQGFTLLHVSNVTIKNATITSFTHGIVVDSSFGGNVLSGNNVTANITGITLFSSGNNTLSVNTITANDDAGIILSRSSDNNTLSDNTVTANGFDGILVYSSGNVLSGNNVTANYGLGGIVLNGPEGANGDNVLSGNTVTSNYCDGITLIAVSGNVLSGNNVTANREGGIVLDSTYGNVLSGNTVTSNRYDGILTQFSYGNVLSGNTVTSNGYDGIRLGGGHFLWYSYGNNTLSDNTVTSNGDVGIELLASSGNVLFGNAMAGNQYNFGVNGNVPSDFVNNVTTSNTVDGKIVYYLMNQSNTVISPETYPAAGYLDLVNCENVTVQGLTLTHNEGGLLLAFTDNSRITNNTITSNKDFGLGIHSSSGNVLSGNAITANAYNGIFIGASSDNNTLSGNTIISNAQGVILQGSSDNNTLSGNAITANVYTGIIFVDSTDNKVFHNNFLNNSPNQANYNSTLTWDDGYPSGGNYWSDYTGTDLYSGQYQNVTGSDGIGDTPYVIDANNTDHYPLMGPFKTFNAGTWNNVSYSVDIVGNSTLGNFSFNPTAKTLTFDVTGTNGTLGFSRVAIPKGLMWTSTDAEWTVTINGALLGDRLITNDTSNTYIYFKYQHSTQQIQIQSTGAVPEFQPFMLMPLFMIVVLLGALVFKKRLSDETTSPQIPVSAIISASNNDELRSPR